MKRNMYQWVEGLKSQKKKAMPILSFPGIEFLGITVKELVSNSDYQAQCMSAIAKRTPACGAVSIMDLSVEAEAFGSPVVFLDDEVPTVTDKIIETEEDIDALRIPSVGEKRTGICVEGIKKAAKLIEDRPVFAGVIGSFSLAGRLLDVTEALIDCYTEPELLHKVLAKATTFLIEYVKAFKNAGANGVVIAEPLAGLLSLDLAKEFSEPYIKQIVDAVQDENFIVIYHNCGNTVGVIIDSILSVGAKVYHFGNAVDMLEIMKKVPNDVVVMGNIDPAGEFKNGTPQSIKKATKELIKNCGSYLNFVPSSGCDIPPLSKWENIDAFFQAVEEF